MLDDLTLDCPTCGNSVRYGINDVAQQRTVRCSRGHNIDLIDDGGGARKVQKSMKDLDKALRNFGN